MANIYNENWQEIALIPENPFHPCSCLSRPLHMYGSFEKHKEILIVEEGFPAYEELLNCNQDRISDAERIEISGILICK